MSRGFTLVEILVAISILALIGAISIPNLRRFNDTQTLQNATNDLARVLREAQSSANSRVSCSQTLVARNWAVRISGNSYQLEASCYDPGSAGPSPVPEVRYVPGPDVVNGVTVNARTPSGGCALPGRVLFSAEYSPFSQNRFSNISYDCSTTQNKMEVALSRNGGNLFVCIDKGGAIYASERPCF